MLGADFGLGTGLLCEMSSARSWSVSSWVTPAGKDEWGWSSACFVVGVSLGPVFGVDFPGTQAVPDSKTERVQRILE